MATAILDLNLDYDHSPGAHTVPSDFWGFGTSTFRMVNGQDADNATFRQMALDLKMEVWRAHTWGSGTGQDPVVHPDGTSEVSIYAGFKGFAQAVSAAGTKVHLQANIRTSTPWPYSTQLANMYAIGNPAASNIQTGGTSGSAASITTVAADWLASNINLVAVAGFNEPANNGGTGFNERYYASGAVGGFGDAATAAAAWTDVHQRDVYAAVKAASASLNVIGGVYADSRADQMQGAKSAMRGQSDYYGGAKTTPVNNTCWPHADDNFGYWDIFCNHPYAQTRGYNASDLQACINSLFYAPLDTSVAELSKSRMSGAYNDLRTWLDTYSMQAKKMMFDEAGILGATILGDANGALADACYAVIAMRDQARWNLAHAIFMAYSTAGDGTFTAPGVYTPTLRQYSMRDLCSPYYRTYKKQLFNTTNIPWRAGNGPVLGPASPDANAVSSIQVSAGLNLAGDRLGLLAVNVDRVNSQTLVVNLGQVSTGSTTDTQLLSGSSAAPLSPVNVAGSGISTYTVTLPPFSAHMFQTPVSQVITLPPPTPTTHFGNWTDAIGVNAINDTGPPPVFNSDSHFGNWTDAVGVNAIDQTEAPAPGVPLPPGVIVGTPLVPLI